MSQLNKVHIERAPVSGWTPVPDTAYLVTDTTGKLYVPVPNTTSVMAYCYLRNTDMFQRLIGTDYLSVDTSTGGSLPVTLEFLNTRSPYAVKLTTVDSEYLITMWDALDTSLQLTLNNNATDLVGSDTYALVTKFNPVALWTFDKRYVQNTNRFCVDRVGILKFSSVDMTVAYPSGWLEAATTAMTVPPEAEVVVDPLAITTGTTAFTYMVHVAVTGDCHICTIGNVRLDVDGGMLDVTIGGYVHTTGQPVESVVEPGITTIGPSHLFFVICSGTDVTVIMNGVIIGVFPVVFGSDIGLKGLDVITIYSSTETRQYSGLAVYNKLILPTDILSPSTDVVESEATLVTIPGQNCTRYKVTSLAAGTSTDTVRVMPSPESDRVYCTMHIVASENTVIEYYTTNTTGDGTVPHIITLGTDEIYRESIWLVGGDGLVINVISGSISARINLIGEHS